MSGCRTYNKSFDCELSSISQALRNMLAVTDKVRFLSGVSDETPEMLDVLRGINAVLDGVSVIVDVHLLEISEREHEPYE